MEKFITIYEGGFGQSRMVADDWKIGSQLYNSRTLEVMWRDPQLVGGFRMLGMVLILLAIEAYHQVNTGRH